MTSNISGHSDRTLFQLFNTINTREEKKKAQLSSIQKGNIRVLTHYQAGGQKSVPGIRTESQDTLIEKCLTSQLCLDLGHQRLSYILAKKPDQWSDAEKEKIGKLLEQLHANQDVISPRNSYYSFVNVNEEIEGKKIYKATCVPLNLRKKLKLFYDCLFSKESGDEDAWAATSTEVSYIILPALMGAIGKEYLSEKMTGADENKQKKMAQTLKQCHDMLDDMKQDCISIKSNLAELGSAILPFMHGSVHIVYGVIKKQANDQCSLTIINGGDDSLNQQNRAIMYNNIPLVQLLKPDIMDDLIDNCKDIGIYNGQSNFTNHIEKDEKRDIKLNARLAELLNTLPNVKATDIAVEIPHQSKENCAIHNLFYALGVVDPQITEIMKNYLRTYKEDSYEENIKHFVAGHILLDKMSTDNYAFNRSI